MEPIQLNKEHNLNAFINYLTGREVKINGRSIVLQYVTLDHIAFDSVRLNVYVSNSDLRFIDTLPWSNEWTGETNVIKLLDKAKYFNVGPTCVKYKNYDHLK